MLTADERRNNTGIRAAVYLLPLLFLRKGKVMIFISHYANGDRVQSVATFRNYGETGTVVNCCKPAYIPKNEKIIPLLLLVRFDSGEVLSMRQYQIIKANE